MNPSIIATDQISKAYGKVLAVNRVSMEIAEGEIFGFLGLNGAGKTTMIRLLLGMIRPSSGKAFIKGMPVSAGCHQLWADIGYMVETPAAYPDLTVRDNLEITRKLRNIKDRSASLSIGDKLGLHDYMETRAASLSLGNKQRLGLARAIMHNPRILILDEPTNGLDPAGIVEIRNLLRELADESGVTIFISSHILAEISRIASRIGIIHHGRLISEFSSDEFEDIRLRRLRIRTADNARALRILHDYGIPAVEEDGIIVCRDKSAFEHPEKLAEILVAGGCPPRLLDTETEDLESYFFRVIEHEGALL